MGHVDVGVIDQFVRLNFSTDKNEIPDFRLEDFPIYGARLQNIKSKMNQWNPKSLWQLYTRPYNNTLSYYGFWFANIIGILSFLSVAFAVPQIVAAFIALKRA